MELAFQCWKVPHKKIQQPGLQQTEHSMALPQTATLRRGPSSHADNYQRHSMLSLARVLSRVSEGSFVSLQSGNVSSTFGMFAFVQWNWQKATMWSAEARLLRPKKNWGFHRFGPLDLSGSLNLPRLYMSFHYSMWRYAAVLIGRLTFWEIKNHSPPSFDISELSTRGSFIHFHTSIWPKSHLVRGNAPFYNSQKYCTAFKAF